MSYNPPATTTVIVQDHEIFKTNSVLATCPSCKTSANTSVTTNFSIMNYLLYCFTTPLVWIIFQLIRKKDLNCCDATHTCSGCGSLIANYTAC